MVGLGLAQSDFVCGICGLYLLFPLCPPLVFHFWPLSVKTAHLLCWIQAFLRCKFEVESHDQVSGITTNGQAGLFSVTGMLNSSFGSGEMAQQLRTLPFVPSIHVILLSCVSLQIQVLYASDFCGHLHSGAHAHSHTIKYKKKKKILHFCL